MAHTNQLHTVHSSRDTMKPGFRSSQKADRTNAFGIKVSQKSASTPFGEDFLSEHSVNGLQSAAIRSVNGAAKTAVSPQCCGFPS